jgi:hypothetical protein
VPCLSQRGADSRSHPRAFAAQTGRGLPSIWAQPDADALLRWHAQRTRSHRDLSKTVELLADLRQFAPLLTAGGLAFQPWPGLTKEQVLTHVLGDDAPPMPDGTLTPLLPLEAFIPLFLAARAYVEVFAADILRLHRCFLAGPATAASVPAAEAVRAWARHPETRVPVHTARSAALAANKTLPGEPIWRVIARLTGTSPTTIRSGCRHIIQELIDEGRTCPGLGPVTARAERPDGSTGPWRGPFETLFDLNRERAMLRAAACTVLAGLTGMRDSEAQDLRRGAVHDHYGTPALKTRRHKLRGGEPEPISWWACDLALDAYRVLEALSEHPDHVIAGITRSRRAGINARQAMHSFAAHINTTIAATGLAPIPGVSQLSPEPGPLHDLCAGAGCPNAHYTPLHLPGLHKRRLDTAQRLASAASGSAAAAQLAADLAETDTVITQLEGHHQ